ncbi:MAG: hypothetical protein M3162_02890 [Thermoproteota archaeon]|nr:hypothetical protein [Thermoproteota archaeon]
MPYTLLIGNNFITNSPKQVQFKEKILFTIDEVNEENTAKPAISSRINGKDSETLIEVNQNKCMYCDQKLTVKKNEKDHVLITEKNGEIIFESRVLDKSTLLVSGIYYINETERLTITQNYIILPSGKWVMHSRIDAGGQKIIISNDGIATSG